jgi:hypothetical protein
MTVGSFKLMALLATCNNKMAASTNLYKLLWLTKIRNRLALKTGMCVYYVDVL